MCVCLGMGGEGVCVRVHMHVCVRVWMCVGMHVGMCVWVWVGEGGCVDE